MAEAGKIIKLIGDVKAINVNGEKSLNLGDAVSLNDTIRTIGKDTSVDIELSSGKVLHIVGDNVAKIDNSILTSESFENEAAIDDKINNLINNLVNNNGEIELDATAAGEAGAAGATGTLNDVVFDQSGSESTVYADVLSREVDNNVITNFNNNGLGAANLNDLLAQGNQVTPEINGEANNGEIPTIPGNNGANDNVVPENPENNTGNNTQPEVKPEEKPENTEDVVTPEVKPEEDKTEDNTQPEVKPEDKPENTEDVVTPEVKPEEDKTEDNTQPEVKPEEKPENTEDVVTPEVKPEPTPVVPEDKPVDNVIPSTPLNPATKLFTDILITSINGDNTAVDDRAEVSEGKLVITAKLDDFKGKEGEYTFTVNSNLNNAGLEQKVTAYVNANGEFTFTMDSNVVNNEQGMIKLSIGSVSDTANIFYVPATPDNTDDKPVDVVTPEVKPEDKPENTEDNKQPEVKPEAPLFDKLVITEVNGDESLSDKLAKVDNNELVIKAKLEGFTGNAGDYIFTIGSNIIGATNSVVSKAYVDENGNFTITLDSNIVNQETGLISVSLDGKYDTVRVEYNAPVVEAVDADIKVDIFDNKGTNIEDTLNNNKELTISGSVSPVDANGNKVEFNPDNATITINGEKVNATINPDGSFTTTYTPSKDGEVKVEVSYDLDNGKAVKGEAATTIDTTAPLLGELTGTPDNNGNYVVEGKTEPNAVVTINGKTEVKADADGNFKATLNDVKDGEKLELVAKDEAGNTSNIGTINAKIDAKDDAFNFKVFQGDEDGYFNNLTEIPNGGRTFDTTPTFKGTTLPNDTIVLGFVKANNATGQDELFTKIFQAAPDGTFTYTPDLTNRVDGSGWEVGTYKVYVSSEKTGLVKEFTFTIDLNTAKDEVANDNNANVDVVVPSEKNGIKISIFEGDESGDHNNLKGINSGATTVDTNPTFVGEIQDKGIKFIVVGITHPDGKFTSTEVVSAGGKFTFTPELGCNNFGDYKFAFTIRDSNVINEVSLKVVADTQTNTPNVDNTASDVVVGSENGIINIKPSEQDNNAFNFKVFQGDEDGYFNNLTEIPNGGRTFDTTPTFKGTTLPNDTIVLGFVKANNATGQDELFTKIFQAAPDGTFTYTPDLTNRVDGSGWEVGTYKVYVSSEKTGLVKEFTFTIDLNTAKDEVANDNNANVDVVVPSEVVASNNHITINEGIYYQANSNSAIEKINGYVTDSVSPVITGTAKPGSELIVNLVNDATGKVESWTNITIWDSGKFEIGLTGEKGNSYHYEVFESVACKPIGEPVVSHTFEINAGSFINLNPSAILGDDAGISIPTIKEEKVEAKDETKVNVGDILDTQKDIFNETIAQPAQVQEGYINLKLGSVAFDAASKDLTHLDEFNNINHHS